jgi:CheY-like chemotaxis protein
MARILIVDDDADSVRITTQVLRTQGYEVSAADDRGDALAKMEQASPDLMLLDQAFNSGSNGLIDEMSSSKSLRTVPVVILASRPDASGGLNERMRDMPQLVKPVELADLRAVVADHIKRTAFIYSPRYAEYQYGPEHPLEPGRARETVILCERYDLLQKPWVDVLEPQVARPEVMELFHDRQYVSALEEANDGVFREEALEFGLGTLDCPVFPGVYDYSALVTGGTILAADLVKAGKYDLTFNPAGGFHHAQPRNAEGFCYINDIAIAIRSLVLHSTRPEGPSSPGRDSRRRSAVERAEDTTSTCRCRRRRTMRPSLWAFMRWCPRPSALSIPTSSSCSWELTACWSIPCRI